MQSCGHPGIEFETNAVGSVNRGYRGCGLGGFNLCALAGNPMIMSCSPKDGIIAQYNLSYRSHIQTGSRQPFL